MKNKKLIISAVVVFAFNAVIFGFWFYLFSKISAERSLIQNLREEIKTAEKKINNARSLSVLLQNIKHDEEKISAMFLSSKDFVGFIEKLEFIGRKSGINLAIKTVKLPNAPSAEKPQVGLQIRGSFNDIFHYLSLFENLPHKLETGKLNLIKYESDKKTLWQADMEIKILSYY